MTASATAHEERVADEVRFRLVQQAAQVGTFEADLRSGRNVWDARLEEIHGLPPGGFGGRQEDWEGLIHPEDRPHVLRLVEESTRSTRTFESEWRVLWPDGSVHWVQACWTALADESGRLTRLVGVNFDVTQRRRARAEPDETGDHCRCLFESMREGVIIGQAVMEGDHIIDFAFLEANPSAKRLTGLDAIVGRKFSQLGIRLGATSHEAQALCEGVLRDGSVARFEIPIPGATPQTYAVTVYRAGPTRLATLFENITERRRQEEALRNNEAALHRLTESLERQVAERTAKLEEANRELNAFASNLSHDLRAPLRGITGYAGILQQELATVISDDARRHLDALVSSARELADILADLHLYAKLSSQRVEGAPTDVRPIVEDVWAGLAPQRAPGNPALTLGDLPRCKADRALLAQAFKELLSNACKFTKGRSEPRLEVRGTRDAGHATVTYSVSDNGVGFDPAFTHKLFIPFQRLHDKAEFAGTGLGLAGVRRIADLLGGRVSAQGEPGRGATFSLTLPSEEATP